MNSTTTSVHNPAPTTSVVETDRSPSLRHPPSSPASSTIPLPSLPSSSQDDSSSPGPDSDQNDSPPEEQEPPKPSPASFARRGSMSDRGVAATSNDRDDEEGEGGGSRLTAIFRPDSDESWREQLRIAGEQSKGLKDPSLGLGGNSSMAGGEDLDDLRWEDVDDVENGAGGAGGKNATGDGEKSWEAKRTLRR
ncbi:hypothetical protein P7C70_g9403, partial [Phenoliferia sp. Uapishka_3]